MHHLLSLLCRLYCFLLAPSTAHYINGGPSLPPPLTPEQEKALLARMMAGDAAARDDLITHNLRLVVYLAKKYENSGVPQEDMISIGTIGLIKAVNTFTPARNIVGHLRQPVHRQRDPDVPAQKLQPAAGGQHRRAPEHGGGLRQRAVALGRAGQRRNLVGLQLEQAAERATLRRSVEQLAPGSGRSWSCASALWTAWSTPKGSRRCPWHQPELHFPAGKADHPSAERGTGAGVTPPTSLGCHRP